VFLWINAIIIVFLPNESVHRKHLYYLRSVSTTRVHGPSSRAELTARELGCIFDTRQLGPSTRVVETGRPCTRAVYTGSGNHLYIGQRSKNTCLVNDQCIFMFADTDAGASGSGTRPTTIGPRPTTTPSYGPTPPPGYCPLGGFCRDFDAVDVIDNTIYAFKGAICCAFLLRNVCA